MMNVQEFNTEFKTRAYLIVLTAVVSSVSSQHCESRQRNYFRLFTNKSVKEDPLFNKTGIQSQSHCLHVCTRRSGGTCLGFVYNKDQQRCMGFTSRLQQLTQTTEVGSVGFEVTAECDKPDIPNGTVTYTSLEVNSVAYYSCMEDFKFVGLSQSRICTSSGLWDGTDGSCEPVAFYNVSSPFEAPIPGTLGFGSSFEILGTPIDEIRMLIYFLYTPQYSVLEIDVIFNVNTYTNTVLRFTRRISGYGTGWVQSERLQADFPFATGRPFNLTMQVTTSGLDVYVDQELFTQWAHNIDAKWFKYISLKGMFCRSIKIVN